MTREEAVEVLKERYLTCVGIGLDNHANRVNEALDMAIEALSTDAVSREDTVTLNSPISIQAEMVAVVRCKDCRYRYEEGDCTHYYWCRLNDRPIDDTDFCAWGGREKDDSIICK